MSDPDEPGTRGDLEFGTIPQLVTTAAERHGDAEALVDVDAAITISFRDLATGVRNAAASWIATGIAPGDRVAIWAPNIWEWVVAALGVHSAGRRARPAEHALQGPRSRATSWSRAGARVLVHRGRVPRHRLRRPAAHRGRRGARTPRPAHDRGAARRRTRRHGRQRRLLARGRAVDLAEVDATPRSGRAGRPLRSPVHVGHHRRAEGRHDDARAEPARVPRLGATSSACAPATATSSSTRSSTRSATRPASSPAS